MRDTNRTRIAFDLDDVLWDMNTCWLDCYNLYNTTNEHFTKDQVINWDIERCLKPENPQLFWALLSSKGMWASIDRYIYESTRTLLEQLATNPYIDLYIATASHPENLKYKLAAFKRNFPFVNWKKIIVCQDKTLLDMDIWVDDKPELVEKVCKAGKNAILVQQPWNERCQYGYALNADFGANQFWHALKVMGEVIK